MSGSTVGATRPKSVLWAVNQPQAPTGYVYDAVDQKSNHAGTTSRRWELLTEEKAAERRRLRALRKTVSGS